MRLLGVLILLLISTVYGGTRHNLMNAEYSEAGPGPCVERIIQSSSKCLAARYNMRPIGTSVSMPADNVKRIGVHFEIVGPLTQDQLRPIMVDCVNQFINSMNANEELRPYLHDYPTSIVNVDVVLFVVDSRGGDLPYPNIVVAKTRDSDLLYSTIQWTPERKDFIHVARESFQVATDIVARSCD
jgi:hypothetical protein